MEFDCRSDLIFDVTPIEFRDPFMGNQFCSLDMGCVPSCFSMDTSDVRDEEVVDQRKRDPFNDIPDEILKHIFSFIEPSQLFDVADTCHRFRHWANEQIRCFRMDLLPASRTPFANRLIIRMHNLRSLDLSDPSCRNFLDTGSQIKSFASSLATACRKIESFKLLGTRGARVLCDYSRSLGPDTKVKHVSLDILQAAIGCAGILLRTCRHLKLKKLSLGSRHCIRRNGRTTEVLSQLFSVMLPGIESLELNFQDEDQDVVIEAVKKTSDLKYFAADETSSSCLAALAGRCPNIVCLKIGAGAESFKKLHLFPKLCMLWISLADHVDNDAEDLEWTFRAEPLCSQLRVMAIRGFLTSDPLLAIGRLSQLETLIVDHSNYLLFYETHHNHRIMKNLKQIIVLHRFETSIAVMFHPVAVTERTSGNFHKLFPSLTRIQFTDCQFLIENKKMICERVCSSTQDSEMLFRM